MINLSIHAVFSVIVKRLVRDRPTTAPVDTFSFRQVFLSLSSPHVILVFITLFMNGTTLLGLALFLPTIVSELGFSPTKTQLVSVGPFATGFVGTYTRVETFLLN